MHPSSLSPPNFVLSSDLNKRERARSITVGNIILTDLLSLSLFLLPTLRQQAT